MSLTPSQIQEIENAKQENIIKNQQRDLLLKEYKKIQEDNRLLIKQLVDKFNDKYGTDLLCFKIRYVPKNIKFESEVQESDLLNFEYIVFTRHSTPGVDDWYNKLSSSGTSRFRIYGSILDVEEVILTNKSSIYKKIYFEGFPLYINPLFVENYKLPTKPEIPTWDEFLKSKGIENGS